MAKYDPNKDYSAAIEEAKASGASQSTIKQLETERQAKIDDKYGGKEPTMWGSNLTYSKASNDGDTDSIHNAMILGNQYSGGGSGSGSTAGNAAVGISSTYDKQFMSPEDVAKIEYFSSLAKSGDKSAHAAAEAIRAKYGYSGGQYGDEYIPFEMEQKFQMPEYDSKYSSQIDSLLNSILNREPFSYDHMKDPNYHAYADQYKRLGDRAREDVLGDVASMNGGYASSWAATAASQAQNDYNQQLSDVIPTLYDAAYNRYLNEDSLKRSDLGIVQGLDDTLYGRYRDSVGDYQWQQEFDTGNSQWEQEFLWNQKVDEWNMSNTEETQAFDQMMSKWKMTGVADAEVANALGVPVGATTESYYFNKAQLALDQAKAAKGNGSGVVTEQTDHLADSIVRNAKALIDKHEDYGEGAKYILSAVTSADEFYKIGSQAGIPSVVLDSVFDSFYDQALKEGDKEPVEANYAYYAALMGQQEDPEAWLVANKYSIPSDILEDLYKLLDY